LRGQKERRGEGKRRATSIKGKKGGDMYFLIRGGEREKEGWGGRLL